MIELLNLSPYFAKFKLSKFEIIRFVINIEIYPAVIYCFDWPAEFHKIKCNKCGKMLQYDLIAVEKD